MGYDSQTTEKTLSLKRSMVGVILSSFLYLFALTQILKEFKERTRDSEKDKFTLLLKFIDQHVRFVCIVVVPACVPECSSP